MKRKALIKILGFSLTFVLAGLILVLAGYVRAEDEFRYPLMRPDQETLLKWQNDYLTAARAKIDENINSMLYEAQSLGYATSMDLLDHIDYDPNQRSQGACGNCWVWAGTGVMEIAHDVDDGVFDRLSTQYLNSCRPGGPDFACCGGNLGSFAAWYSGQGLTIPWDNANASFADGWRWCGDGTSLVPCASISTTPNYPINSIQAVTIDTYNAGQAQAITNIKNILNQDRAVFFGFALPDSAAWQDFSDFWDGDAGETEANLWPDTDTYCGDEWNEAVNEAGAHAVVIVGYNDDGADPANHYWIVLNSWGTADGVRPNGLFRIPTQMNYDCLYPDTTLDNDPDVDQNVLAYQFQTLDVEFGNALPIADVNGPYNVDCGGPTTIVALDGSGSIDLEDELLSFHWSTDCAGGVFDDATSETPMLTAPTSPGCFVTCSVSLTVTDNAGATDTATTSVTISDTDAPVPSCPADVTTECDASTDPSSTGYATAVDSCDPAPTVTYTDVETPGLCPEEKTIARTWTAIDICGHSSSCVQEISVIDTTPPLISWPADVTLECDESTDPSNTGYATATDSCDPAPTITYADVETPGCCLGNKIIARTWTATDNRGNSSSGMQSITMVDTASPIIRCNAPGTITPPDAPISFAATAADNCDDAPSVVITDFDCFKYNKNGKRIDKKESCRVEGAGDSVAIRNTGGVGTHITWGVRAVDDCENVTERECEVEVVKQGGSPRVPPGQDKDDDKAPPGQDKDDNKVPPGQGKDKDKEDKKD